MTGSVLLPYFSQLEERLLVSWQGRVTQVVGNLVESVGPPCCLGECCEIRDCHGRVCAGDGAAPSALDRLPIREPLGCGVRAIDAFLTCGRGQRLGIFGGSGVGKSTLIGMMARGTAADLTVLALVGERG